MFIVGAVNINYLEKTKSIKELKNIEKEFGLKQYMECPTRVTRKSESLIDHIYTNSRNVADS